MIHFHAQQIIGRRETQQDAFGHLTVSPHCQLLILADGMGGHQGGETASQTAVQAFLDYFANPIADELPSDALHTALLRANAALHQIIIQRPELNGMGTTLLAVLINENGQFDYISVGDSPLYYHISGSLKRINANHAFASELEQWVAEGKISAQDAAQHPQRHAITSALTGNDIAHIDQQSGNLNVGARLLLASDGIHTLPDEQIAAILTDSPVAIAVAALMSATEQHQHPHQDNTTALLIERTDTPNQTPRTIAAPNTLISQTDRQPETQASPKKWLQLGGTLAALFSTIALIWIMTPSDDPPPAAVQPMPIIEIQPASQAVPPESASTASDIQASHIK